MIKKRLDILLVEQGLVETRAQATMLIKKSGVYCDGVLHNKPGVKVFEDSELKLVEENLYVSRGAYKLIAALDSFDIMPAGLICADIGASTGGFTEVLLERGASKVYAIDVGRDQLAKKLRESSKVVNLEQVNARYPIDIEDKVDLIVSDLSHISLLKVLPEVLNILKPGGMGLWLIKPQFEAGKDRVGKGGIVDPKHHGQILKEVVLGMGELGAIPKEIIDSPIQGKRGNREYLTWFIKS